jgi:uncharacterized C2H2 Zn-finger protein
MTKIYLIKHLDSGMKYVGITDGDLVKRWQQHYNDPNSAVYSALRSEGYRMTMELLDDVPSREEALRKEQDYIRTLGTAQPHGWNRMVSKVEVVKPAVKKWRQIIRPISPNDFDNPAAFILKCPLCGYEFTHHTDTIVYTRKYNHKSEIYSYSHANHINQHGIHKTYISNYNPSPRRNGIRIEFGCEGCHGEYLMTGNINETEPPIFSLLISQHKGQTEFALEYYEEATQ